MFKINRISVRNIFKVIENWDLSRETSCLSIIRLKPIKFSNQMESNERLILILKAGLSSK
jgi:hypothetical protein